MSELLAEIRAMSGAIKSCEALAETCGDEDVASLHNAIAHWIGELRDIKEARLAVEVFLKRVSVLEAEDIEDVDLEVYNEDSENVDENPGMVEGSLARTCPRCGQESEVEQDGVLRCGVCGAEKNYGEDHE